MDNKMFTTCLLGLILCSCILAQQQQVPENNNATKPTETTAAQPQQPVTPPSTAFSGSTGLSSVEPTKQQLPPNPSTQQPASPTQINPLLIQSKSAAAAPAQPVVAPLSPTLSTPAAPVTESGQNTTHPCNNPNITSCFDMISIQMNKTEELLQMANKTLSQKSPGDAGSEIKILEALSAGVQPTKQPGGQVLNTNVVPTTQSNPQNVPNANNWTEKQVPPVTVGSPPVPIASRVMREPWRPRPREEFHHRIPGSRLKRQAMFPKKHMRERFSPKIVGQDQQDPEEDDVEQELSDDEIEDEEIQDLDEPENILDDDDEEEEEDLDNNDIEDEDDNLLEMEPADEDNNGDDDDHQEDYMNEPKEEELEAEEKPKGMKDFLVHLERDKLKKSSFPFKEEDKEDNDELEDLDGGEVIAKPLVTINKSPIAKRVTKEKKKEAIIAPPVALNDDPMYHFLFKRSLKPSDHFNDYMIMKMLGGSVQDPKQDMAKAKSMSPMALAQKLASDKDLPDHIKKNLQTTIQTQKVKTKYESNAKEIEKALKEIKAVQKAIQDHQKHHQDKLQRIKRQLLTVTTKSPNLTTTVVMNNNTLSLPGQILVGNLTNPFMNNRPVNVVTPVTMIAVTNSTISGTTTSPINTSTTANLNPISGQNGSFVSSVSLNGNITNNNNASNLTNSNTLNATSSLNMSTTDQVEKELETAPKGLVLVVKVPGQSNLLPGQEVDGNLNPIHPNNGTNKPMFGRVSSLSNLFSNIMSNRIGLNNMNINNKQNNTNTNTTVPNPLNQTSLLGIGNTTNNSSSLVSSVVGLHNNNSSALNLNGTSLNGLNNRMGTMNNNNAGQPLQQPNNNNNVAAGTNSLFVPKSDRVKASDGGQVMISDQSKDQVKRGGFMRPFDLDKRHLPEQDKVMVTM